MVDPVSDRRPPITPQLALRVAIFGGIALVLFAVIFFRLWYLQVLEAPALAVQATQNRTRVVATEAPRGRILDAKFKTYGCGSAIASSSLVTEWVKGKSLDEAMTIKNTQIAQELALPPVKIHCSILAEDAIKAAVEDYRKKVQ